MPDRKMAKLDKERVMSILAKNWRDPAMTGTGAPEELEEFSRQVEELAQQIHSSTSQARPDICFAALITLISEHVLSIASLARTQGLPALALLVRNFFREMRSLQVAAHELLFDDLPKDLAAPATQGAKNDAE